MVEDQPNQGSSEEVAGALTSRERAVYDLRATGESVAQIASALGVAPRTVRFHLEHVYAKLGISGGSAASRQLALARHWDRERNVPSSVGTGGQPASGSSAGDPTLDPAFFRTDRRLTDVVARGRFTLSAEITPPRNGAEQAAVLDQVAQLVRAGAQFLAVTKGAGGSLRGGSLPIALAIKERFGVPAIAHFTCRDLVPEEVENQLIDHHYAGIRNILALRGDPPDGQPDWQPRPGGYAYAYQLVEQIAALNAGRYLQRAGGSGGRAAVSQGPTDFCVGVAVYPEHADPQEGLDFFRRKLDAGAAFAITQMVFDADLYGRFLDRCERAGIDIPILPGTRVVRSRTQAMRTGERFGVSVAPALLSGLRSLDDPDAAGRASDLFVRLAERLRTLGAPGLHLFVTNTDAARAVLERLAPPGQRGK